ncbi:hypothetical protein ACFX13_044740 [Malus domestica]
MRIVPSTYHQLLRYATPDGIKTSRKTKQGHTDALLKAQISSGKESVKILSKGMMEEEGKRGIMKSNVEDKERVSLPDVRRSGST